MTKKSLDLASRLNLPTTGGSDSHIPETIGRCFTEVESKSREVEDIIEAIKNGRTKPVGSGTSLTEKMKKIWRGTMRGGTRGFSRV